MLVDDGHYFDHLTFRQALQLSDDLPRLILELQRIGALHSKLCCPTCDVNMQIGTNSRYVLDGRCWRCPKKDCKKTISIRRDSYFSKSHLGLGKCFMIIYCYLKFDKMLQKDMAEIIEVSERAIVDWANFIRESISNYFLKNPQRLGTNHPVQIDESLFGGRCKYHRGDHHIHKKSWVFGMVEEETRLCVYWAVDDRKRNTLTNIIKDHIVPGAIVKSDEWSAYASLGQEGYQHLTVNHSLNFVSVEGIHTQLIESTWAQIKSILKIKRGTSSTHLSGYLDLYSFFCMAKHRKTTPFDAFINIIKVGNCY